MFFEGKVVERSYSAISLMALCPEPGTAPSQGPSTATNFGAPLLLGAGGGGGGVVRQLPFKQTSQFILRQVVHDPRCEKPRTSGQTCPFIFLFLPFRWYSTAE